jgi:hypothetical protein
MCLTTQHATLMQLPTIICPTTWGPCDPHTVRHPEASEPPHTPATQRPPQNLAEPQSHGSHVARRGGGGHVEGREVASFENKMDGPEAVRCRTWSRRTRKFRWASDRGRRKSGCRLLPVRGPALAPPRTCPKENPTSFWSPTLSLPHQATSVFSSLTFSLPLQAKSAQP